MTLMRDLGRLSGLSAPFPALDRDRALQGLAGDVVRTLEPPTPRHIRGRLTGIQQRDLLAGHVSTPRLKTARSELVRLGLASEATEATAGRPTRVLVYTGRG